MTSQDQEVCEDPAPPLAGEAPSGLCAHNKLQLIPAGKKTHIL